MMDDTRNAGVAVDHDTIEKTVIATLDDLVQDWDIEAPIEGGTKVVADLGFESIDLIQMVAALERAVSLKGGTLVEMLVADGRYVDDLTVDQSVVRVETRVVKEKRQA